MKIIAFVIACLVLVLSVMPCADEISIEARNNESTEITKAAHQHEDNHQDECSPFCQCACCAGLSIHHTKPSLVAIPFFSNSDATGFLPANTVGISFSIWQPPRLC